MRGGGVRGGGRSKGMGGGGSDGPEKELAASRVGRMGFGSESLSRAAIAGRMDAVLSARMSGPGAAPSDGSSNGDGTPCAADAESCGERAGE